MMSVEDVPNKEFTFQYVGQKFIIVYEYIALRLKSLFSVVKILRKLADVYRSTMLENWSILNDLVS